MTNFVFIFFLCALPLTVQNTQPPSASISLAPTTASNLLSSTAHPNSPNPSHSPEHVVLDKAPPRPTPTFAPSLSQRPSPIRRKMRLYSKRPREERVEPMRPQLRVTPKVANNTMTIPSLSVHPRVPQEWFDYDMLYNSPPPSQEPPTTTRQDLSTTPQICPEFSQIIENELFPYSSEGIGAPEVAAAFDLLDPRKRIILSINQTGAYVHLEIPSKDQVDGHVLRCIDGFIQTFSFEQIQNALHHAGKKFNDTNPTVVLSINLHASDIMRHKRFTIPVPIFSYCKARGNFDILLPRPYLGEFLVHVQRQKKFNLLRRWEAKQKVAVFRGALTHHIREDLAIFSLQHPTLVDAKVTRFVITPTNPDIKPARSMSLDNQFRSYAYVFYADGHGSADRLPYLLVPGNTLVLMAGPDCNNLQAAQMGLSGRPIFLMEFYYPLLHPGFHLVQFKSDLSDLEQLIPHLRANDEIARAIAANGAEFVRTTLTREKIECYMRNLMLGYYKLQRDSGDVILSHVLETHPELKTYQIKFCDPLSSRCGSFRA